MEDDKWLRIIIIFAIAKSGYWDLDYQQRATTKYYEMSFPWIFYSKICKTTFSIHSRMWNQECFCVGVCSQKILTHCVLSYNIILQWIRLGHIIDGGTSYIHKGEIIVAAAARYTRYTLFVPFTLASSPTHSLDSFSLFAYRIYWTQF